MSIERDENIVFDDLGTLIASTRWISTHDEGIAEWMKNARLAYQIDRANVIDADRVCVLLLKDLDQRAPARIGLLDVGGAAIEDIERWSKWNDPFRVRRGDELARQAVCVSWGYRGSNWQTDRLLCRSPPHLRRARVRFV